MRNIIEFLSGLFHKTHAVDRNNDTKTLRCSENQSRNKQQDVIYVKLNSKNSIICLFLSIRDEDGTELYHHSLENAQGKILIDACTWRCGLYSISLVSEEMLIFQTLFFLFGKKKIMVLLNDCCA
jgi:hypothetical protein